VISRSLGSVLSSRATATNRSSNRLEIGSFLILHTIRRRRWRRGYVGDEEEKNKERKLHFYYFSKKKLNYDEMNERIRRNNTLSITIGRTRKTIIIIQKD